MTATFPDVFLTIFAFFMKSKEKYLPEKLIRFAVSKYGLGVRWCIGGTIFAISFVLELLASQFSDLLYSMESAKVFAFLFLCRPTASPGFSKSSTARRIFA